MSGSSNAGEHVWTVLPALKLPHLSAHDSLIVEYTWLTMGIVIVCFLAVCFRLKKNPRGLQNVVESIVQFLELYTVDLIGPKGLLYFPLILTVFSFIFVANYIGLIPGFLAPTSSINTTAACAIVVFLFYQYIGFRKQGMRYLKHFLGPIPVIAPFMFVMEIISEFARPFSLSLRLYANIMGGHLVINLLVGICAFGLPVVWMIWESLITAPIQAFVFSMLTMIYLAGAIASDEH